MATNGPPPPGIPEASRLSTHTWQTDLLQLFHNAKDRFPDVVWELHPDDDHDATDEVWGHKGLLGHPLLLSRSLSPSDRLRTCPAVVSGALLFVSPSAHHLADALRPLALSGTRSIFRIAQSHARLCPQLALSLSLPRFLSLSIHPPGQHSSHPATNISRPLCQRARVSLHGQGPRRGV